MKRFFTDERGQSVVEFALVAPILLLVLCAIIDFGWIFSAQIATDNCAREGARHAAIYYNSANIADETEAKVKSVASDIIKNNITATVTYSNAVSRRDGDVTVTVVSEVRALTFVAYTIFGGETFNLASSVTMKAG